MSQSQNADQQPSIEELLETSDWEARLEDARERRKAALRRRAERKAAPNDAGASARARNRQKSNVLPLTNPLAAEPTRPEADPEPDADGLAPAAAAVGHAGSGGLRRAAPFVLTALLVGFAFAVGFSVEPTFWQEASAPTGSIPDLRETSQRPRRLRVRRCQRSGRFFPMMSHRPPTKSPLPG